MCKLKKISNDLKAAEEEEAEEDMVPEDVSFKAHVLEDSSPVQGKRKKKSTKEIEIESEESEEEKETIEDKPKKKRVRGIVKKAMAELEAERLAKQAAQPKKAKSSKEKKGKAKKGRTQ